MIITSATATSTPVMHRAAAPAETPLDGWAGTAEVKSMPELFRLSVAKNPDGDYLGRKVGDDYRYLSYRETQQQVEQFASGLIELDLSPGDRVAIFADNRPEWRVADWGIMHAGCVPAPLYNQLSDRNVEYVLRDSEAKVVVVDTAEKLEQVLKSEAKLPNLEHIVVLEEAEAETGKKLHRWADLLKTGTEKHRPEMERRIAALSPTDIGSMVYTSGSTGDPKGVLLAHGNWLSELEGVVKVINSNPQETLASAPVTEDVYPSILPQGHVMGRVTDYAITAEGGTIAYPDGLMGFRRDLKGLAPTVLAVTPLFFRKIFEDVEKKAHRDTSLVISPAKAAALAAGAAGAVGALAGALAGSHLGSAALGAVLVGGTAAGLAGRRAHQAASEFTRGKAFDDAVTAAREFYEARAEGDVPLKTGLKFELARRTVFPQTRAGVEKATGGRLRLMMSGGAPLPGEVEGFFRASGLNIAQGYGLSETAGAVTMNPPLADTSPAVSPWKAGLATAAAVGGLGAMVAGLTGAPWAAVGLTALAAGGGAAWAAHRFTQADTYQGLGTVGRPLDGVEVRIDADTQEIQVKGPNIMAGGYLKKEKKTRESFTDDNWFRTGDTGRIDKNGNLTIVSRLKSQFKLPGGEYVSPEPIEEDLKASPFIQEAVVTGARDRDIVGALIVPNFDNLADWCRQRGLPTEPAQMATNTEVLAMMKGEALERSSRHATHERVRAVALLDHEFTVEADELTPSFKVKRPVVLEKYDDMIQSMF